MKIGVRKPSIKKSVKARTTGKMKRKMKKALIPGYGKKGMGWIKNPKKAAYNKVYNKTSFSVIPSGLSASKKTKRKAKPSKKHQVESRVSSNVLPELVEGECLTVKVCKYCNAENPDGAAKCSSCGASEFKYKCGNCGSIFEDGLYCPTCGVKVGQKSKKCPRCGKEFYSNACPDCGYTPNQVFHETVSNTSASSVKTRKTWLWVLGWIFIFPIPLTIIMLRKSNLNKWIRIAIIIVAWAFYLLIGFAGSKADTSPINDAGDRGDVFISTEEKETANSIDLDNEIDSFVKLYNENAEEKLEFVEAFVPSDNNGNHYRTVFRLNAYRAAKGKSYSLGAAIVDIIAREDRFDGPVIRVYASLASLQQCCDLIQTISPIYVPGISEVSIQNAIRDIEENKEANGYYFDDIGIVLTGNEKTGFSLMIKPPND